MYEDNIYVKNYEAIKKLPGVPELMSVDKQRLGL